jgi:hypothetical protein
MAAVDWGVTSPLRAWSADAGFAPDEADAPGAPAPAAGVPVFAWQWAYDRASVNEFLRHAEAERVRLHADIRAADHRLEIARATPGPRRDAAERELGALVLAAQVELSEIEREHRAAITTIREDAVAEASRLLTAAREQAVAAHERAQALAAQRSRDGAEQRRDGGDSIAAGEPGATDS